MLKSRPKRHVVIHTSELSSKKRADHHTYATRQRYTQFFVDSEDDDEEQIMERRLRYSRRNSPYSLLERSTLVVRSRVLTECQRPTTVKTDVKLADNIQSKTEKLFENPCGSSSKKKSRSIDAVECQSDISLDRITRDEIVRKVSTCLSFYGNFVIIPAIKETLSIIEEKEKNVKFNYWYEVMNFIDSYDFPYVSKSRKKLIDDLVEKITEYVENEGISAHDWQNIICTLPDDVTSKFDHRLDSTIMEEVGILAKQDRLPFNLSKSIVQLLESGKKHAGKYIRNN
jgi:hypothetical protein